MRRMACAFPRVCATCTFDFTALSRVVPEKVWFPRQAGGPGPGLARSWSTSVMLIIQGTCLPRTYRFRVLAANNSGVSNEAGAALEFSIDAAYYQTRWFRATRGR